MTTAQARTLAVPSFDDNVKMEERKRSLAADDDDLAPSRKRQIKDENGQQMRMDAEKEKDVEAYQKDAIMRQMKEYKREKRHFEDLCNDLSKRMSNHDDHLRTIDAWFAQLLDEVRVLAADALPTPPPSADTESGDEFFNTALNFEDNETFSTHLRARSRKIKDAIADIFGRIPAAVPEVRNLQERIAATLAREKATLVECQRLTAEKEQLTERLEAASYRYMKAEKALDRAKSAQVQKLERQAIMGGNAEASSPAAGKKSATPKREHEVNGDGDGGMAGVEAEAARKEAVASAETLKKQLEELEAENDRLTNALSAARTKVASLTDDDYAETSLFKTFKSQHEDVIKRINDLEATNVQLREEAQKLQAERTTYRFQLDEEAREQNKETEGQIARCEVDLARIRHSRDELTSELAIRRQVEETKRISADQARELAEARHSRIVALESEVERLKLRLGDTTAPSISSYADLDNDALQNKLRTLETQHNLLSQELPAMEAAWKKTQALAQKKVEQISTSEEMVARLYADKAKAEQKYFAAMKAKEFKDSELRVVKNQNSRSSEIVSQLKDTDNKTRELVVALERQLAETKDSLVKLEHQYRSVEQKHQEGSIVWDGLRKQIEELKVMIASKDKDSLAASKAQREAEDKAAQLKVKLEEKQRQYDALRKQRVANSESDSDDWRKVAICPVCNANIRNTVLKLCGHVFCHVCVKDLISNRSRKCPSCGKAFGNNDQMSIVLT